VTRAAHDPDPTGRVLEDGARSGEDCYFMKLSLRAIDDLEHVLDRFTPHGRTTTSIVHWAPVPSRPLPVQPPPE